MIDDISYGKSAFGVFDRRLQNLCEFHRSIALEHADPPVDGPRHGDGMDAALRHAGHSALFKFIDTGGLRRAPARIEGFQLFLFGIPDDREKVATWTNHHRFDDTEHRRSRDSRIDRIAALLEDSKTRSRSERLAGGNHSIHRPHGGTGPASRSWFIAGRQLLFL